MNRGEQEIMLGGRIQHSDFLPLIKTFKTSPDGNTLMLLERQPSWVVQPEQRQELLLFSTFVLDDKIRTYTTGRIFHLYGELRWEWQRNYIQIVYTGKTAYAPEINNSDRRDLDASLVVRKYFLFGKRLDERQRKRIGPMAQPGNFAEVRIPRLLHYPDLPALAGAQRVQLVVCEYIDTTAEEHIAYRFKELVAFDEKKNQRKKEEEV